jgi:HEAT repeat protein
MYASPQLPVPPVEVVFPEEELALWLKALGRPEVDLKCRAAEAIARACRRGRKGLDVTVAPLVAALEQPDQHPAVRLAAAHALVALEAKEAAEPLFRQARAGDGDLRAVVEPALARWDYQPARAVWLERLADPAAPSRGLVLAMQGLAAVREGAAADRLREILLSDRVGVAVRLEAARALGAIRDEGLEADAERLAADSSAGPFGRLAAAALLRRHRGEAAVRLLQRLAEGPEPAAAALALTRLLELDAKLAVPATERALAGSDPRLRSLAVETLLRQPTEQHVRLLGDRLDDAHPDVRSRARRALHELAADGRFRKPVIDRAAEALAAPGWRGQEQAALLLAQLDHKPAAGRLVGLLTADRPEVAVTAAWGLRRLAVAETLPAVVRHVADGRRRLQASDPAAVVLDHQLSQLNQLIGRQKHQPAEAVLRQFIPRVGGLSTGAPESRAAAIWALGLLHEGKEDDALAGALEGRLNDTAGLPAEDERVRLMSAITLGRLGAKSALPSLRKYCPNYEWTDAPINNACCWAVERLTGNRVPAPKPIRKVQSDPFLTPDR